jgi:[ribosomal protein S18]-alanine N-acetyltransferase
MRPADLAAILEIQHEAGEIAQWHGASYRALAAESQGAVLVATLDEGATVAGFVAARAMEGEAEIRNLAVRAGFRRLGIARRLIEAVHAWLAAARVRRVFLEVRPSNAAARSLYRSFGYSECGLRRNYYQSDGEDALVLELALPRSSPANSPAPGPAKTV